MKKKTSVFCGHLSVYRDKVRHDKISRSGILLEGQNATKGIEEMIEIVYDKGNDTTNDFFSGVELPKNIRQIGAPHGLKRIYIEDYVMTFLTKLAAPDSTYARGAILVGEVKTGGRGSAIFISGAIAAQNLELDLQESSFDDETWGLIYKEVKEYFPELSVVGWFLSRMGFSTEVNDMIQKLHVENFSGENKVLFVMDALENEDAFYMIDGNYLRRQTGYYIYYARNEEMQNYMIDIQGANEREADDIESKDEEVLGRYKHLLEERAKAARIERVNRHLCALSACLVVAVLALGVAVLSNYRMLGRVEHYLAVNDVMDVKDVMKVNDAPKTTSSHLTIRKEKVTSVTTQEEHITTTECKDVPARYYTVQDGDTLSSISFKMYNSVGYVAELMEANGLTQSDEIHEGDEIVIPSVAK
ncbi:MAG: LysM peptidoglycan-binding domain-containing protein [Lachnospiraceae bacterium]|nr:LysM peptidoglycan-binding domain-containing protein [Lachnospiraceae bacterium]